ncbi:MAG TPA: hypothetical protein VIJ55_01815 [Acetobacteraceae bacterium]
MSPLRSSVHVNYSGVFTLLSLLSGEGRDHHGAILAEAARLAEAGTARGKIVVDLGEDNAP